MKKERRERVKEGRERERETTGVYCKKKKERKKEQQKCFVSAACFADKRRGRKNKRSVSCLL
jgi:hypothetical protein